MAKNTTRLGRGLSALLESPQERRDSSQPRENVDQPSSPGVLRIPLSAITPNPSQPRMDFDEIALQRLAESIRRSGILQPVLVRPDGSGGFQLIAGERRFRAAKIAGLDAIPAIVREVSDESAMELALIENLQREDLGPIERARAYSQYLAAFGATVEELAERLSESRTNITNYLRLLNLSPPVMDLVASRKLGMGQARALITIEDPQRQLALANLAIARDLSVRQVEALGRDQRIKASGGPAHELTEVTARKRHYSELELVLTRSVGIPIRLRPGKRKNTGQIIIHYGSLEDFERVIELLGARASLD